MSTHNVPEFDEDLAISYTVRLEKSRKWPGKIVAERWFNRNGELSARRGQPAETYFDPETGAKIRESHYRYGSLSDPGRTTPAVRIWNSQGQLLFEAFYMVGDLHRDIEVGPALIEYDPETGRVVKEEFYNSGVKVAPPSPPAPDFTP